MPFTFAHPAAVLWCARWERVGAPLSAFVVGSLSPDFEYFLRLRMLSFYSHSALGILTFCVPVGIVVYVLYQSVIAPALYRNLPRPIVNRLPEPGQLREKRVRHMALVPPALAFGAATHILWDGFTHGNGPFVLHWPVLETEMLGLPLYKYLQHGSTLAGFAIMGVWFLLRRPEEYRRVRSTDGGYWPIVTLLFLGALVVLQQVRPGLAPAKLVIQCIVGLFVALLIAGFWFRVKIRIDRN
ncbi:MAG: DUF4184 family protein [Candidatus Hydrogenedentes bacterium]|nr:DUF4184 family protein [Candidatus Hydrogenedentota bacterium]